MRILWVSNTIFPDFAKELGMASPIGGGWMYGLAKSVSASEDTALAVAAVRNDMEPVSKTKDGIRYYLLKGSKPREVYDHSLEQQWSSIIREFKPDLVHIHGTEFAPGLALLKSHPKLKAVISIQGLVGVCSRYYAGGLSLREIISNITFRDLIKRDSILQGARKFKARGTKVEKQYLETVRHIVGRTQWDHDHVTTINPGCHYHFCNESLRDAFYQAPSWNLSEKKNHSIFLSQALYPLKGLHKVLEAVRLLKQDFPSIQVRVAGPDPTAFQSWKDRLRMTGYGKLIKNRIHEYGLEEYITFTGPLDADQMISEYRKAHVFICPSSIENSPNSLGEAQLLGVPSIASYVGGVPDMVVNGESGLMYRFEEVEMLAQRIKRVFRDDELALRLSKGGKIAAKKRHNQKTNTTKTLAIYKEILSVK